FPEAAKANRNVFYAKDGRALTVGEVYDNIDSSFANVASRQVYDDNQVRADMLKNMTTALSSNEAMTYAASVGVVTDTVLEGAAGFLVRGKGRDQAYEFYGRQLRAFKPEEEAEFSRVSEEGSVNQVLESMQNIQSMGRNSTRAA